jgi:hypothetical protein
LKIVVSLSIVCFIIFCSSLFYSSYQNYIDPEKVYGTWLEMGVPDHRREVLVLNQDGVFKNDHLISTTFEFDGTRIYITTGIGITIYQITGTISEPQLKRISPANLSIQEFARPETIKARETSIITPPREPLSLTKP